MSGILKVAKNEYLIREGDDSSSMYYLQTGTMSVFKRVGDQEKQIGTIYPGEVVGEMSFLDHAPRSASVKAITDCELVAVPSEKFERMLNELPSWYRALVNTLLDRLRKANARIKI